MLDRKAAVHAKYEASRTLNTDVDLTGGRGVGMETDMASSMARLVLLCFLAQIGGPYKSLKTKLTGKSKVLGLDLRIPNSRLGFHKVSDFVAAVCLCLQVGIGQP